MARNGKKAAGSALSAKRLQKTVKADDATILLSRAPTPNQTVRNSGLPNWGKVGLRTRLAGGVSRVAHRISPKVGSPTPAVGGFAYNRKANRRLRKIAKQMARQQPRKPRSRVPLVVMLFLGMLTGLGYYTYQLVPWQGITNTAAEYLDYNDWLAKAAGKKKPASSVVNTSIDQPVKHRVVKRVVKRSVVNHSNKTKALAAGSKKSVGKASGGKRVVAEKKVSQAQRKAWKQGLAKLKKKSTSDYRRASHQYKKRD